jgi:molybdopterin-guanine dinucleotide biosynthesis protein A
MRIAGMILAGGRSSRMGRDKALVPLQGRPLLAHVITRLAPQVERLAINANGDLTRFLAFDLPLRPDRVSDRPGPLAGIAAALAFAREIGAEAVAVVPADAPFLPLNVVARLAAAMGQTQAACAQSARGLEPLFSLWRIETEAPVLAALARQEGSPRAVLSILDHRLVDFTGAGEEAAFANLNTPQDLADAEAQLQSHDMRAQEAQE